MQIFRCFGKEAMRLVNDENKHFCRFGFNSMISEVIREDEHSNSSTNCDDSFRSNHSDDDFDKKSDNAIDYSDINELAEDLQVLMQEVRVSDLLFSIDNSTVEHFDFISFFQF